MSPYISYDPQLPGFIEVQGPRARRFDPGTSHAAARTIGRGAEEAVMDLYVITEYLSPGDGWTDDELAASRPDFYAPTLKSARSRLSKAGLLIDSGKRRPSDRGRAQIVWRRA